MNATQIRNRILFPLIAAAISGAAIAPAKAQQNPGFAPFTYAVQLNLSDVQADLEDDLNAIRHEDRCGASWNITDARVTPAPNGRTIRVNFRARVAETQCTYTNRVVADQSGTRSRPRTRNELIGEATKANYVTFAIEVSPKVNRNAVSFESKIVTSDATGALSRSKLDAQIKDLVTEKLLDAVEERIKPTIPTVLARGNAKLGDVLFVDIGGGKLGLSFKANGQVRVSG